MKKHYLCIKFDSALVASKALVAWSEKKCKKEKLFSYEKNNFNNPVDGRGICGLGRQLFLPDF